MASSTPEGRRVTLAVCRAGACPWNGVRFPLRGLDGPSVLVCGGCGGEMSAEDGVPHPISYIDALIGARGY